MYIAIYEPRNIISHECLGLSNVTAPVQGTVTSFCNFSLGNETSEGQEILLEETSYNFFASGVVNGSNISWPSRSIIDKLR